jgi:hypothetical protein
MLILPTICKTNEIKHMFAFETCYKIKPALMENKKLAPDLSNRMLAH